MLQVIKHKMKHLYQNNCSDDSSALVISKNKPFHKKMDKKSFEWKGIFFAFFHFNSVFVTPGHIQAIFNFWDPITPELSHSQSPQHSRTYLQNLETNMETHFILWQSSGNLIHFSQKCPNFVVFKDLKLSDGKTIIANPIFFFRDSESCMSQLSLGTKVNPDKFSNHGAKISSTLWD